MPRSRIILWLYHSSVALKVFIPLWGHRDCPWQYTHNFKGLIFQILNSQWSFSQGRCAQEQMPVSNLCADSPSPLLPQLLLSHFKTQRQTLQILYLSAMQFPGGATSRGSHQRETPRHFSFHVHSLRNSMHSPEESPWDPGREDIWEKCWRRSTSW